MRTTGPKVKAQILKKKRMVQNCSNFKGWRWFLGGDACTICIYSLFSFQGDNWVA